MELQSGEVLASWQMIDDTIYEDRVNLIFMIGDSVEYISHGASVNTALRLIREWEDGDRGKA